MIVCRFKVELSMIIPMSSYVSCRVSNMCLSPYTSLSLSAMLSMHPTSTVICFSVHLVACMSSSDDEWATLASKRRRTRGPCAVPVIDTPVPDTPVPAVRDIPVPDVPVHDTPVDTIVPVAALSRGGLVHSRKEVLKAVSRLGVLSKAVKGKERQFSIVSSDTVSLEIAHVPDTPEQWICDVASERCQHNIACLARQCVCCESVGLPYVML